MMTKTEIDEIRARCEAATPGPWVKEDMPDYAEITSAEVESVALVSMTVNAKFIAKSREDIPRLLDALEESERKCRELEASLERETAGRSYLNRALNSTKQELDYFKSVLKGKKKMR